MRESLGSEDVFLPAKSLAKNSFYNVLYRLLTIVFPLVTSIYIARVLKAESIGLVAAAQNNAKYFTMVAALGIPTYGVKLIAQYKVKSKESSKAFSELFVINGILSIACSVAYVAFVLLIPYFRSQKTLYFIVGLVILFNIFNVDWFYQGIQEYGYITIRSFIVKILSLVGIILFVHSEKDFYAYAIVSTLALVGNYVFNVIRLRRYIVPVVHNLEFREHLSHILILFASSVAVEVYVLADTTMLDLMCSSSVVGYYTMSMRVISVIRTMAVAISAVFLPQMSYLYFSGRKEEFLSLVNKGIHILGAVSIPVAIGFCLIADDAIVLVFGDEFKNSILTARILSLSIITVAYNNFIGLQILVTLGKEKITTISTICGAITNVIMNYFLIMAFQHNGAAVASATTECVVTLAQIVLSARYIKISYKLKSIVVSCLAMSVGVIVTRIFIADWAVLRLVVSVIVGGIIYAVSMYIMKDEFVMLIFEKAKCAIKRTPNA